MANDHRGPSRKRPNHERKVGNELRDQLRIEQHNRCHWCDGEMEDPAWAYPRPPMSVTLDHVIERCCGGELTRENCVAACHGCNQARAAVFNACFGRLRRLVERIVRGMGPAEIETRLGAVLTVITERG